MAAYNAQPFIKRAIDGVRNQDVADFVCCIVDDGSTDGTGDLARQLTAEDPRFIVIEQENQGQAVARNFGMSHLPNSTYVSFPDADDEWHTDALRILIEAADALGGSGSHALADRIDVGGHPLFPGLFAQFGRDRFVTRHLVRRVIPVQAPSTFESLVESCTVYPPGLWLMRRDIFEKAGGFSPWFQNFEDWDLLIRASRFGDFAFVDKVILKYRSHPAQISLRPDDILAFIEVRAKTLTSPLNTPAQRKMAAAAWRTEQFRFAGQAVTLIFKRPRSALASVKAFGDAVLRFFAGAIKILVPIDDNELRR
jgi:glycosyltransferase involved in cell wall biosynthesis